MFHINLEGLSDGDRSLYVSIARDVSNSLAYRVQYETPLTVDDSRKCSYESKKLNRELVRTSYGLNSPYCWGQVAYTHQCGHQAQAVESVFARHSRFQGNNKDE